MSVSRVIKKYPNRRLYDTHISRYITLEEIRQLVLDNVEFRVEDKRTRADITRSILLQVIAEQEEGGDPIFSSELLGKIIRLYGDPMQTSASRYLDLSIELYLQQHQRFAEQIRGWVGQAQKPIEQLKEISLSQVPIWRLIRREFLKSLSREGAPNRKRKSVEDAS